MQYLEDIESFCNQLPGVSADFPFGEDTIVFRVFDKIFLLSNVFNVPLSVNLKADPEQAILWREEYDAVKPGYHMNKKHWNTVSVKGRLSDDFIKQLISSSYHLVIQGLPKKAQKEWESLPEQTTQ